MSLPIDFRNILNLYNLSDDNYFKPQYTVDENISVFTSYIDSNRDGLIQLAEYQNLLRAVGLPTYMADNIVSNGDTNGDSTLDHSEFLSLLQSFDTNGDNLIEFNEALNFYNSGAVINIDPATNFKQYSYLFSASQNFVSNNDVDRDAKLSVDEYTNYFVNQQLSTTNVPAIMSLYDVDGDGMISIEEHLAKNVEWDTNHNGLIEFNLGEAQPLLDLLPNAATPALNPIEYMAKALIYYNDGNNDGMRNDELDLVEYKNFLGRSQNLPVSMADRAMALYSSNGTSLTFDNLVAMYNSFDSNGDHILDFTELLNFQNSITPIAIDPATTTNKQYIGLYKSAVSAVKSLDGDFNGEVSVDDYRAMLQKNKQMYDIYKIETPEWMAENFVRTFDLDKTGTVNVIEMIKKYMEFDTNKDGVASPGELQALTSKMNDSTLWKQVDEDLFKDGDKDKDNCLSLDEYKATLKNQGMPDYISNSVFNDSIFGFDKDLDGKLSRLEFIEMYSRYDGAMENQAFYESITGAAYSLNPNGNKNYKLDSFEKLKMYTDLTAIDYGTAEAHNQQYDAILATLQDFVKQYDLDKNGLMDPNEYKTYLKTQGLADYMADNAITAYDANADTSIDYFELLRMNIDFDINANGKLELNEVLSLCENFSGVPLNATTSNENQYSLLYDNAQLTLENYDISGDRILSPDEIKAYYKLDNLPDYIGDNAVTLYDLNGDAGIDVVEFLRVNIDLDANQNGELEFNEKLKMYDDISGVGLNPDTTNVLQYTKLFDTVKTMVIKYDLNKDKTLSQAEVRSYFKEQGMPDYVSDQAIAAYDLNADGGIDLLEWMKIDADFDADKSGKLEFSEDLNMLDNFAGTGIGSTTANSIQLSSLKQTSNTLVQRLDTDNNEILSPTELRQLMKEQNLPDYIADQMVTNFDLNADGGLDTLEFTKAYSTFDHNQNGKLDFNESLEMNSITSGANIVAGPDDIKQYQAIFNYTDYFIKLRDDTTDRKLTPVELSDYFRELKMPDYMATSAVTRYDLNGDGSLDVYEWMKPHIAFDVNINGKIDFNELMGMAEDIAGITIPVTPTNEIQVTNLYNSSLNFLKTLDKDNDIKFGFDEYRSYLLTQGLPDNLAQSIINLFDVNADSGIDIMEWLKANVDYDANLNGVLDFNETLNMYQAATGIAFNATESNKIQYQNLYKAALSQIAFIDKDTDKKFSVSEYSTYLRQCNLPDYMANNGVNLFDINNDGSLDALEWMKALIDNDTNSSGAIDYDELINLYSQESGTGITANQSNIAQYKLIFGIGINNVIYMDTDANKICSAGEYEVFLRKYGMPDYVTNNAITTYDMNGDGGFDAMEWTRMVINFDINRNGKFDLDEVMNYYGSVTGINFGANPSNLVQFSNIYNNSIKVISSIDTSGNKIFNESEYTAALKAAGLPSNIATGMIAYFDLNNDGGIDSLEFMKLTKDLDHNSNGLMDFNEAMDYYSAASGINLGATEANSKQYGSLWNQSLATIKAIDKDNDKRLSVDEYRIYLRSIGLPDYVANNAVASIDLNHDGGFDAIEWMRNSLNLDTNNSGVIDFRELLNYYGAHSGIAFNTTINNEYQHQKAYSASLGTIKYMDLNQDKIMDLNEYRVALKAAGLPEYVASGAMSAYDLNGDGGLDALEWTRLTLNLDGNQNGVMDFYEVMQFYETATGINFNASINNATQLQKCYSAYNGFVRKVDLNYDQRMSADEYRPTVLAAKKPSSAADNAISIYDINGDGGLDTFEWMIAVLNFDANQSGVLEGAEVTAWYASF